MLDSQLQTSRHEPAEPATARHEIVVVGARVAGAATALLLARQGRDVALIDRDRFPSDTLSTHAISRAGMVQLHRFGLLDDVLAAGTPAVREVAFFRPGHAVRRTVRDVAGVDFVAAPRRQVLDALLVEAARRAGATVYTQTRVTGLRRHPSGRVCGVEAIADGRRLRIDARFVVGADGLRSTVAELVGAELLHHSTTGNATFYSYVSGLDAAGFEYHLGPSTFVGVFPTNDAQACLWLCAPVPALTALRRARRAKAEALLDQVAAAAPALADRLGGVRVVAPVRGAVDLPNLVRAAHGPGWALVGDAGFHRDPITGHGITDAFRDAELCARALEAWLSGRTDQASALNGYERVRNAVIAPILDLTRSMAAYPDPDRFGQLQRELGRAIETEALMLADLPEIGAGQALVA